MATIKAPFNFVPLSDKIFFPEWADQISQDIPFSDGLSGTIELKITVSSVWPPSRNVFFSAKRDAAVSAFSRADFDHRFICKL